jgi:hypothetical protein
MPKSHRPYAPEFRRQMVDLVRSGRTPEALSREFEPTAQAMIPTTKAAGSGVGVIAQLVLELDYLLPNSVVGRPIFAPH